MKSSPLTESQISLEEDFSNSRSPGTRWLTARLKLSILMINSSLSWQVLRKASSLRTKKVLKEELSSKYINWWENLITSWKRFIQWLWTIIYSNTWTSRTPDQLHSTMIVSTGSYLQTTRLNKRWKSSCISMI